MLLQIRESKILALVDKISTVVVDRFKDSESYIDTAFDVLLHQFIRDLPRSFFSYLHCHRNFLEEAFSAENIEVIGCQRKMLCNSYHRQLDLWSSIDSTDDTSLYYDT